MAATASVDKGYLRAPYGWDSCTPWQSAAGERGSWSLPEPKIAHGTAGDGRLRRWTAGRDTNRRSSCTLPPLQPCWISLKMNSPPAMGHSSKGPC